jgi:arylsulfatase A-like enzyme
MNQSFFERISSLNIRCMLIFLLCVKTFTMKAEENPNIIMIMADDLGWGDVGFNGNTVIRTPHLDDLASEGINFKRFYSASPVCSPTRGSCLTGRHPYRYGIEFAMSGHIKKEELLIPEILKDKGYTTGHFGKWHLGTLTLKEQNRWGEWEKDPVANYSPPWENGVDFCFVTESKVPTWNPMLTPENWSNMEPGSSFGNDYWTGPGKKETHNLEGDDSRVIMDRVIPFVEKAEQLNQPFFAVIWFHTPHKPVVAGPQYKSIYKDFANSEQNYYGCITAMDEQVGRLNNKLKELGIDQNTIIWFCSDNGPEGS